jgi:hypothetical protein
VKKKYDRALICIWQVQKKKEEEDERQLDQPLTLLLEQIWRRVRRR